MNCWIASFQSKCLSSAVLNLDVFWTDIKMRGNYRFIGEMYLCFLHSSLLQCSYSRDIVIRLTAVIFLNVIKWNYINRKRFAFLSSHKLHAIWIILGYSKKKRIVFFPTGMIFCELKNCGPLVPYNNNNSSLTVVISECDSFFFFFKSKAAKFTVLNISYKFV